VDWLFDLVRHAYDRLIDRIGEQWTLMLIVVLIALAIYLVVGRRK
jgi:hypothetical protein